MPIRSMLCLLVESLSGSMLFLLIDFVNASMKPGSILKQDGEVTKTEVIQIKWRQEEVKW